MGQSGAGNEKFQLPDDDKEAVLEIVKYMKSQGIFDEIRKNCLADIETTGSFLGLSDRMGGFVNKNLTKYKWTPTLNKNTVRNEIRQDLQSSAMMQRGVQKLVETTLRQKGSRTQSIIEDVVKDFLGMNQEKYDNFEVNEMEIDDEEPASAPPPPPPKEEVVTPSTLSSSSTNQVAGPSSSYGQSQSHNQQQQQQQQQQQHQQQQHHAFVHGMMHPPLVPIAPMAMVPIMAPYVIPFHPGLPPPPLPQVIMSQMPPSMGHHLNVPPPPIPGPSTSASSTCSVEKRKNRLFEELGMIGSASPSKDAHPIHDDDEDHDVKVDIRARESPSQLYRTKETSINREPEDEDRIDTGPSPISTVSSKFSLESPVYSAHQDINANDGHIVVKQEPKFFPDDDAQGDEHGTVRSSTPGLLDDISDVSSIKSTALSEISDEGSLLDDLEPTDTSSHLSGPPSLSRPTRAGQRMYHTKIKVTQSDPEKDAPQTEGSTPNLNQLEGMVTVKQEPLDSPLISLKSPESSSPRDMDASTSPNLSETSNITTSRPKRERKANPRYSGHDVETAPSLLVHKRLAQLSGRSEQFTPDSDSCYSEKYSTPVQDEIPSDGEQDEAIEGTDGVKEKEDYEERKPEERGISSRGCNETKLMMKMRGRTRNQVVSPQDIKGNRELLGEGTRSPKREISTPEGNEEKAGSDAPSKEKQLKQIHVPPSGVDSPSSESPNLNMEENPLTGTGGTSSSVNITDGSGGPSAISGRKGKQRRSDGQQNQRYAASDLYKPKPSFSSSSTRRNRRNPTPDHSS